MLPTHSARKPRTTPATVIVFIVLLLGLLAFCGYQLKSSQTAVEDLRQQLASLQQAHEGIGKEKQDAEERLEQSTKEVETARKERSDLEKASTQAAAKVKDLDAQRATLVRTHAKDRQKWQTQVRAAQTAEKEARADAAKAKARAHELEAKLKSSTMKESKPEVVASKFGSQTRQQSSGKGGAAEAGSKAAAGKAQTGSAKTTAAGAASTKAAQWTGSGRASDVAIDGSEAAQNTSSSLKQGTTAGSTSKVKTRADGQLTQGAVVGTDLAADGKAASGGEAAMAQSLVKAAAVQEGDKVKAVGAKQKASTEQTESEDVEESVE